MCATCGCQSENDVVLTNLQTGRHEHLGQGSPGHDHEHHHDHAHSHAHEPTHSHGAGPSELIPLEVAILAKNDRLAAQNRGWLAGRGVAAFNLMSSPGAGKTALLERTIRELGPTTKLQVIEGDQCTTRDAERIRAAGCEVVQVNTGAGCHLDALMVAHALEQLNPAAGTVVLIENVGNLVCPAMFDLGERAKVVVSSVTEGDDKPLKYPHIFRTAKVVLLNKMDLLPHVSFDVTAFEQAVRRLNPAARVIHTSATRGDGLAEWYEWVHTQSRLKT